MQSHEVPDIAEALGRTVLAAATLAGGFSHETCLLTLADGQVVARLGGPDPAVEAAVMAAASRHVPVPEVLLVLRAGDGTRPAMVLEHVPGTPLEHVLAGGYGAAEYGALGAEVGRVVADIGAVTFDRPGFFADERLTVRPELPWSRQLAEMAETCMNALSDLVTRPAGHPVADQAAQRIRDWVAEGVPGD
ncbi:phosphotransferase [Microtetraspora sp. NBRC 13810]|uniref:phosphotransferase family protein n=1 Tax=Microtetraspora sp. NBRC 13810 TaxID=3030990 RepID=UPI0025537162|nr:phosphotransferase [Microtetraspora sp. NBRC 13810]